MRDVIELDDREFHARRALQGHDAAGNGRIYDGRRSGARDRDICGLADR